MKNLKGSLLLLLTAFLWGTSFAAQTSAADAISAFAFNGARSLIGSLFLFLLSAGIPENSPDIMTTQIFIIDWQSFWT